MNNRKYDLRSHAFMQLCSLEVVKFYCLTRRTNHQITNHQITQSPNHQITKSPNHPITQSPNHPITQSPNHSITKSPNHPITQSPNKKPGKLLISRRYNRLPLLPSGPGGVQQELTV